MESHLNQPDLGWANGSPCEGGFTLTARVAAVRSDWAQAGRPRALQLAGSQPEACAWRCGGQSAAGGLSASSLNWALFLRKSPPLKPPPLTPGARRPGPALEDHRDWGLVG
ncbi:hypothetical protein MKX07_005511 [Trichoderma sp. CBMAI-0711]|nr:hypothetical protein MKX07_005511 [Trichoderma sp. CBMAI-0711]